MKQSYKKYLKIDYAKLVLICSFSEKFLILRF